MPNHRDIPWISDFTPDDIGREVVLCHPSQDDISCGSGPAYGHGGTHEGRVGVIVEVEPWGDGWGDAFADTDVGMVRIDVDGTACFAKGRTPTIGDSVAWYDMPWNLLKITDIHDDGTATSKWEHCVIREPLHCFIVWDRDRLCLV